VFSLDKWEQIYEQQWETTRSLSWRQYGWENTAVQKEDIKIEGVGDSAEQIKQIISIFLVVAPLLSSAG